MAKRPDRPASDVGEPKPTSKRRYQPRTEKAPEQESPRRKPSGQSRRDLEDDDLLELEDEFEEDLDDEIDDELDELDDFEDYGDADDDDFLDDDFDR